jgi:hypothetical protein
MQSHAQEYFDRGIGDSDYCSRGVCVEKIQTSSHRYTTRRIASAELIEAANQSYEWKDPLKKEDFDSQYTVTKIDSLPAINQVTKLLRCPDVTACNFLGVPQVYREEWFIYSGNNVIKINIRASKAGPIEKFTS